MPKRLRRKPANWVLLLVGSAVVVAGLALATLVKPLPSYLVASSDIGTGTSIAAAETETVDLNLGDLAGQYATPDSKATDLVVAGAIGKGELIPIRLLGSGLLPNQTVVRFTPGLLPAASIRAGSAVSVWQVVEYEEEYQPQRIVSVAEVLSLEYGEGLFADEAPNVELLLNLEQSTLLLQAVAADFPVYVLPLP